MPTPLKSFVNRTSVGRLAAAIAAVEPTFEARSFTRAAAAGLDALGLKARIDHVAAALAQHLPKSFPRAAKVLSAAVPQAEPALDMWQAWPATTYVEYHGVDHPRHALETLARLTPYASAEFAIRPFVERHPDVTWRALHTWATSSDLHLRRLASEGTRPRLPWGHQLPTLRKDPTPSLELLDRLCDDPEEYVRRSVANHLNDVAKDHPDLAIATARRWLVSPGPHTESVVRHALRSLIKSGHPDALTLLGAAPTARIDVANLHLEPTTITLGQSLRFSFTVQSRDREPTQAVIDYVIHHRRANGTLTPKVFKLTTRSLSPNEPLTLTRTHPLRPITTRRYYPGAHRLEIQINGRILATAPFELRV